MPVQLADFLNDEAAQIASACTRCGKCVEICPVVPFGPMATVAPQEVVAPVAAFLAEGRAMPEAASAWTAACNGCGACIPACPEAINPRKMLMLTAVKQSAISSNTPELFRRMSRSIKIMIAMQLLPQEFARLLFRRGHVRRRWCSIWAATRCARRISSSTPCTCSTRSTSTMKWSAGLPPVAA